MSDDIVSLLRDVRLEDDLDTLIATVAADEIVRLRTRVAELERWEQNHVDRTVTWAEEHELADQLAEVLNDVRLGYSRGTDEVVEFALAAYDRARTPATPTEDQ